MSIPNFMAIHPVIVQTLLSKTQMRDSQWTQIKKVAKVFRIYPLGTMNV